MESWALRLAIAAPVIAIIGLGAFRLGVMDFRLPLLGVAIASALAAVAVVLVIIGFFMGGMSGRAILALVVALAFLFVPLNTMRRGAQVPPIHDITTDLKNPPVFEAVPNIRAPSDNSLALDDKVLEQQAAHYALESVVLDLPPIAAFDIVLGYVQAEGWEVVKAERGRGAIEASVQTPLFGFIDDVVIRLTPENNQTRIDMRSASRVGVSDLGANAARIQNFMALLTDN